MLTVLSWPGIVVSVYSSPGQEPGRFAVLPSTTSLSVPTGTPVMWNSPLTSLCALSSVPVCWLLSSRSVTPGTGWPALSSTTPLTEVAAGSPATRPVAVNATCAAPAPRVARATLLATPPAGSRVRLTMALPLASVVTVMACWPLLNCPMPLTTVKVTATPSSRLKPWSVTTATSGRGSCWPATPTCWSPESTTSSAGAPGRPVAIKVAGPAKPGHEASTTWPPAPARRVRRHHGQDVVAQRQRHPGQDERTVGDRRRRAVDRDADVGGVHRAEHDVVHQAGHCHRRIEQHRASRRVIDRQPRWRQVAH